MGQLYLKFLERTVMPPQILPSYFAKDIFFE
jgi:hypothetical protein